MTSVLVDARPTAVRCPIDRTAIVVVDMQNDFGSQGGMFDRAGIDITSIRALIEPISAVLDASRRGGLRVCYLRMGFADDLSDAGYPDGPTWLKHLPLNAGEAVLSPSGQPSRILVRGTWNTQILDQLAPQPDDMVVDKHRYSGFHGTDLCRRLRDNGIDTLIFVGATTSVCVESTVRDAMANDFHCLVVEDCVAEPIGEHLLRTNHDASLLVLELLFASITSSSTLIAALTKAQSEKGGADRGN